MVPEMPRLPPSPANAFIVVEGRRWRASDPGIPPTLRQELVDELMEARRAVRDAEDADDMARSRGRVNDAKIALGERGRAWWLALTPAAQNQRIEAAVRALLRGRRTGASICPSDVARVVGAAHWRRLLPAVRECAAGMAERGEIDILRRGRVVKTDRTAGVLRYRLKR